MYGIFFGQCGNIICFGEFEEASFSSSFQLVLLTHEASLNNKKLMRVIMNCPISVGYHLELRVAMTFYR